jgi:hypothetical protein
MTSCPSSASRRLRPLVGMSRPGHRPAPIECSPASTSSRATSTPAPVSGLGVLNAAASIDATICSEGSLPRLRLAAEQKLSKA